MIRRFAPLVLVAPLALACSKPESVPEQGAKTEATPEPVAQE